MTAKTKAELVYCMDFIMHHLNDEEACVPWLTDGCPDGYYQDADPPPAEDYEDLELTDQEFDEYVDVFTHIMYGQTGRKINGAIARGVLA